MNLSVPENAAWIVLAVGMFIQFLKEFQLFTNGMGRFLPYVAIVLGVVGTIINNLIVCKTGCSIPDAITGGIAIGLMTTGSFEALKHIGVKIPKIPNVIILFLILSVGLAGCSDPNAKLLASQKTFIATVHSLTALQEAGKFTPDETEQVGICIKRGHEYLDQWYESNATGTTPPELIAAFNEVLDELIRYQATKQ